MCGNEDRSHAAPEVARRAGRKPETVRRWIREGRLRAAKVGSRHVVTDEDLEAFLEEAGQVPPLPDAWKTTFWGASMPSVVFVLRRSRDGHQVAVRSLIRVVAPATLLR